MVVCLYLISDPKKSDFWWFWYSEDYLFWVNAIMDNNIDNSIDTTKDTIISSIQTVYDPEFPLIDVWTMGLIYDISISQDILITMTLTTPACPAAEYLPLAVKNAIWDTVDCEVEVVMTFEPSWTIDMIKDEDFKKLFEL